MSLFRTITIVEFHHSIFIPAISRKNFCGISTSLVSAEWDPTDDTDMPTVGPMIGLVPFLIFSVVLPPGVLGSWVQHLHTQECSQVQLDCY